MKMRLSTILLFCLMILCFAGCMKRSCKTLCVREGSVAAFSVLLLALSGLDLKVPLDPAAIAAAALGLALCLRERRVLACLLCALLGAGAARLTLLAIPNAYEAGLVTAIPIALASRVLLPRPRAALASALLAPTLLALFTALEDWFLFDAFWMRFADKTRFDAQICAAALLCAMWLVRLPRFAIWVKAQKEA